MFHLTILLLRVNLIGRFPFTALITFTFYCCMLELRVMIESDKSDIQCLIYILYTVELTK